MERRENKGEIVIYKAEFCPKLWIRFENETIWLNFDQMAHLFQKDKSVIAKPIKNIYKAMNLAKFSCGIFCHNRGNPGFHFERRKLLAIPSQ